MAKDGHGIVSQAQNGPLDVKYWDPGDLLELLGLYMNGPPALANLCHRI